MPRPNTPLPDFLPPRAIYRHLLRECSYLPPAWSNTIVSVIRDRFRQHKKYDSRQEKHRARAYQFLNTLRSANEGNRDVMQKLMRKGLARTGPRRRNLISRLVLPDSPSDSDALEAMLNKRKTLDDIPEWTTVTASETTAGSTSGSAPEPTRKTSKSAFHLKWDKPKVLQFLRSQSKEQRKGDDVWIGRDIKTLAEDRYVRAETVFGTPTNQRLIWKRQGEFWRKQVVKLMPPLEKDEWELLGRLSTGAQDSDNNSMVPTRRTPAKLINDKRDTNDMGWDWEGYARRGANKVESPKSAKRYQRTGQEDTGPYSQSKPMCEISPRWYRRAYARLWRITPTTEQDPHSLKHSITWGKIRSGVVPATKSQLDVFEGVSEDIFPSVKRMKSKPRKKAQEQNRGRTLNAETPKDIV